MGILSGYFDASFDSTQFWEQVQSGFYPGMDVVTEGTLYNRTGGSHTYIDMGRGPGIFEITVGVEAAQGAALIAKRGDSGSLVWSRGTQTATLLDILPTEADAFDAATYTLRFFSDDMPAGVVASNAWLTQSGDTWIGQSGDTWIGQ